MKPITHFLLLCLGIFLTQGCAEKPATPTNFKMTLGANLATDLGLAGGVILTGTNGTDKFSSGLTPSQAQDFSLELPSGDWSFRAVAWMNDGNGMMTGESRCGYTNAKIEDADTVVKLSLSSAKCFDGPVAANSAKDEINAGAYFKKVDLSSCLNLNNILAGTICDGSDYTKTPGVSMSFKLSFPGKSSFGASLPSLRSSCINHPGFASNNLTSGYIPTSVRLPFDGIAPFPWSLEAYEEKNCAERNAVYRMPDGLNGTQGLARNADYLPEQVHLNFADNYLGEANSVFATLTPGDILPKVSCAPNCYPNTNYTPFDSLSSSKESIKRGVWGLLGNANAIDAYEVTGNSGASVTTIDDILFQSYPEDGTLGNNTGIEFLDSPGGLGTSFPTVSCAGRTININYDSLEGTTRQEVVDAVNGACPQLVMASTGTSADPVSNQDFYTLGGGTNSFGFRSRETGDFFEMRNLLLGPIGVGLYKNNITDRAALCSSSGSYDFFIDGENVTMELGTPTASAVQPEFSPNPADSFEKRIRIFFDGVAEEAFYFNCVTNPEVGAYVSTGQESDGSTHTEQIFWSSVTAGEEWVEWVSKEEDSSNALLRQNYFLFKANTNGFNAYQLRASFSENDFEMRTGSINGTELYAQGNMVSMGDNIADFVRNGNDENYVVSNDDYLGPITATNVEPDILNLNMTAPNYFGGYDMASFTSGVDNIWDPND